MPFVDLHGNYAPPPNGTSPVTLHQAWPKLGRLIALLAFCIIGNTKNGFFLSSFFVEPTLRKVGNVFLACVGLANAVVTAVVLPASVIVLLSGEGDTPSTCYMQHFIILSGVYATILLYVFVTIENQLRFEIAHQAQKRFTSFRISIIAALIWCASLSVAAIGTFLGFDYNYCERSAGGDIRYRAIVGVMFYIIPFSITFYYQIQTIFAIRRRGKDPLYKRSQNFKQDKSFAITNMFAYYVFLALWMPYLIVETFFPNVNDKPFYNLAWLGLSYSCIAAPLYGITNGNFRNAYAYLFYYCCCKSRLSGPLASRHRRPTDTCPSSDIRVHIMHSALKVNGPQNTTGRDAQEI